MSDVEEAKDKVMMEKEDLWLLEDEKITAYHEGGHAIVAFEKGRSYS